jgi:hypothetical protein
MGFSPDGKVKKTGRTRIIPMHEDDPCSARDYLPVVISYCTLNFTSAFSQRIETTPLLIVYVSFSVDVVDFPAATFTRSISSSCL